MQRERSRVRGPGGGSGRLVHDVSADAGGFLDRDRGRLLSDLFSPMLARVDGQKRARRATPDQRDTQAIERQLPRTSAAKQKLL
eukprot:1926185-Rhodomonas_salina.1